MKIITKKVANILSNDNIYKTESKVNIYFSGQQSNLIADDTTTIVTFQIYTEASNSGIHSIDVGIKEIAPFTIMVEDHSDDAEIKNKIINIDLDPSRIDVAIERKSRITVGDINLYLNTDMSINYDDSSIVVFNL